MFAPLPPIESSAIAARSSRSTIRLGRCPAIDPRQPSSKSHGDRSIGFPAGRAGPCVEHGRPEAAPSRQTLRRHGMGCDVSPKQPDVGSSFFFSSGRSGFPGGAVSRTTRVLPLPNARPARGPSRGIRPKPANKPCRAFRPPRWTDAQGKDWNEGSARRRQGDNPRPSPVVWRNSGPAFLRRRAGTWR